ncbi:MAG: hypothetical protein ACK4S4_08460 [Pyrinomonadaceae bacterium]
MNQRIIQITGIAITAVYFAFIVFLYAAQPRDLGEVTTKAATTIQTAATRGQVIIGTYEIDRAKFDAGLAAFRQENYVAARDLLERADPERRHARTQFYIAYSFYRQGWGRVTNDDELFAKGIEAVDRVRAIDPDFAVDDPDLKLRTPAELRAELENGTKLTAGDFNPLRIFTERK